jgi:type IV pilus assembly protein PilV
LQGGVVLIEALLGILIFSIGILALIGMQAVAVQNTADARYRSEAAFLANQAIAQMWVDRANLTLYHDANTGAYAPRTDWRTRVEAALPGVDIAGGTRVPSIVLDVANENNVTVTVFWLPPGQTQQHQFSISNRINGP